MKHLEGLNEAQKRAVTSTEGPLLIVAGAGAGKTKTITHRIVQQIQTGVAPERILAVTFTNKAAGEMRDRVYRLIGEGFSRPPLVTTFHSLGVRLLREFAPELGIVRSFAIWDRDDSLKAIKKAMGAHGYEQEFPPRQALSRISREKGEGVRAEEFRDSAHTSYERMIGDVWVSYDAARTKEGALDFDDLLVETLRLMQNSPQTLERLRGRWSHITIDEYQDTNAVQYEIARLLVGEKRNICAVADLDQLIYSWRGAKMENLLSFERVFPGTTTILLEQNYRSTQTIITAANAIIEKNTNRIPKRLFTDNPTGDAIRLFVGETERDEAYFVAREARALLSSGVSASDIAVLFRENFQSRALEEAFIAIGVPYRVLGVRFFERAEVKDVLAYLKAARNEKSMVDFSRAAGAPPRGIGATTLERVATGEMHKLNSSAQKKIADFKTLLTKIHDASMTLRASETVRLVIKESGLEKHLTDQNDDVDRLRNVYELASHATRYDTLPPSEGIEKLLEDAALMTDQDELEEKKDAVTLMTVHASKGLEFDAVFVTGLEHGLFPSVRDDDRDPEEERRLMYVAVTRAKKFLYLTCASSRLKYGSRERTIPSPFLNDIDERLLTYAETPYSSESIIL